MDNNRGQGSKGNGESLLNEFMLFGHFLLGEHATDAMSCRWSNPIMLASALLPTYIIVSAGQIRHNEFPERTGRYKLHSQDFYCLFHPFPALKHVSGKKKNFAHPILIDKYAPMPVMSQPSRTRNYSAYGSDRSVSGVMVSETTRRPERHLMQPKDTQCNDTSMRTSQGTAPPNK